MDVGPLPEMPCWEELRAGCLMSSCEGDSDPGQPGVPRCYCDHQIRAAARMGVAIILPSAEGAAEAFAETVTRTDRFITTLVIGGFTATEEPGRIEPLWMETEKTGGVLAPWQRDWGRQRAWRGWSPPVPPGPEQDKIDAYFRGEPPPDTLEQARRKWLDGHAGIREFLDAVDRADLPELDRLPRIRDGGPWWRRLLLRVIRAVAGPRRVM